MTRIAYVNGAFVLHEDAQVSIDDRGYLFADGVYEYIAFYNRRLLDLKPHVDRLARSLKELGIAYSVSALPGLMRELLARNTREEGGVYLQVTRGVAKRDHAFPTVAKASVIITVSASRVPKSQDVEKGASVITHPDIRWGRCDIKTIALLPNVLAKQAAVEAKAREAWLVRDGVVTEGAVSNAFIVKDKTVITHPVTNAILNGITRQVVLELAQKNKIAVEERAFTVQEVLASDEAFITGTSANVLPVTKIDGEVIGGGKPGDITQKLMQLYYKHIEKQTGKVF